jgi:hypothetical protein
MSTHLPVNHPLRPLYRALTALVGGYTLLVGIVGVIRTQGTPLFAKTNLPWVLGVRTNLAFALLSIVSGAILLLAVLVGRNVDYLVNLVGGIAFMVVGMLMLALLQTDANVLGFTMTNVIVSFVLGSIVFTAGLYGRTGSAGQSTHHRGD